MSSLLYRIGRFAGGHPWRVLATWALVAAGAFLLNTSIGGETTETFRLRGRSPSGPPTRSRSGSRSSRS
jgi:hypothetical protein